MKGCAGMRHHSCPGDSDQMPHLQGLDVEVLCMPAPEHCQASVRYPGRAAQRMERSCQPLPQLALHACHGPVWTCAPAEPAFDWLPGSEISARAVH